MATTPLPTPGTPDRPGVMPTIDQMTPPPTQGRSWLGVDPSQRMTAGTARRGLEGYFGRAWTSDDANRVNALLGRQFNADTDELTGEEYNRLLEEGARLTGGSYQAWSTTAPPPGGGPPGTDTSPVEPPGQPVIPPGAPAPDLEIPEYQARPDFAYDEFGGINPNTFAQDPSYQWRFEEGQRALTNASSARGNTRGGNFMRDLIDYGQGAASQEYGAAWNRALQQHQQNYGQATGTYDRNVGQDRYGHEQGVNRAQLQYAPRLLSWQADRDDSRRNAELEFDRDWQREIYGRDDAWRRHVYSNDDVFRRYQLEEQRRQFLAAQGNQ